MVFGKHIGPARGIQILQNEKRGGKITVVLVLRIQVFKEISKIFALFYQTKINVLKEVLREVLEVGRVEIIQPEKSLGQNTVSYSSFKWILL